MNGQDSQRTPEEKIVKVNASRGVERDRPNAVGGVARYLSAVAVHLDSIEYGDPSEFLLARTGHEARHASLSEVWVPPVIRKLDEKSIERDVNILLSVVDHSVVILVPPGYGKSTLARYLTCFFAREFQATNRKNFALYVPLSMLRLKDRTYQRAVVECALRFVGLESEELFRKVEANLVYATIIFDGLDELPAGRGSDDVVPLRAEAAELIRLTHFPASNEFRTGPLSSIVTCRTNDYFEDERSRIPTAALFEICNFLPKQAEQAVLRWHDAALKLAKEARITAGDLAKRGKDIIGVLAPNSELGSVCLTPLMLNILQTVHSDEGDLPSSASQLCERAAKWLLIDKHRSGELAEFVRSNGEWIQEAISNAAFALHAKTISGAEKTLSSDELRAAANATCPPTSGAWRRYEDREDAITRVAAHLRRGHGILHELERGRYDFADNVFREVLAGRYLGGLPIVGRRAFALNERWHAPIRYLAGIKASTEIGRQEIKCLCRRDGRWGGKSIRGRDIGAR
jgi:NACHT domain